MNIMKISRIIAVVLTAIATVSCFETGNNRSSYPLEVSFEYPGALKADSLYFDTNGGLGFAWGAGGWQDLGFYHKLTEDKKQFLGGFMLSGLKAAGAGGDPYYDSFRVATGVGLNGTSTYAVFHDNPDKSMMPEKHVTFLQSQYGTCTMAGVYVNNTIEVVKAVREHFTLGDRLTLKAVGYLNNAKTGEAQFVLADYSAQKNSLVVKWTPFDLDKLGSVDQVQFSLESTKQEVPAYVCMDSMVAYIAVEY